MTNSIEDFLFKLSNKISKNDITKENQEIINLLLSNRMVVSKDNYFFISSKYKLGFIDIASNGRGFLIPLDGKNKDIPIEAKNLNRASKGDIVIAKRLFNRGKKTAKVSLVLFNKFKFTICYTKKTKSQTSVYNIVDDSPIYVVASQKSLKLLPDFTILKVENINHKIIEVLGHISNPKVDEKISLALFNIEDKFSDEVYKQSKSFGNGETIGNYSNRVDLTNMQFCTIDPKDAKDHDDAVFFDIKNNSLYVAIADVSEYVDNFTAIDKEARNRCFSIYLPHKAIPMLPPLLSENICSLKEGFDRLAFVFKIDFDNNFNIKKYRCFEAIVNCKKRYTYDEVDKILNSNTNNDPMVIKSIRQIDIMAKATRKKRLKKGFDYQSDEVTIELDKNFNIFNTTSYNQTNSHILIEESMLLANCCAADMLKGKGIFRVHEKPSLNKIDNLLKELTLLDIDIKNEPNIHKVIKDIQQRAKELNISKYVDRLIIRSQKKARYDFVNSGHFGLGFSFYTHFTSPIRRYSDLLLHRILKTIIKKDKKYKNFILQDIAISCQKINNLEKIATKVEYDFKDRVFARWASKNINSKLNCIISDNKNNTIATVLETEAISGARIFIDGSKNLQLFCKVKVTITKSNILNKKIYGKIENI